MRATSSIGNDCVSAPAQSRSCDIEKVQAWVARNADACTRSRYSAQNGTVSTESRSGTTVVAAIDSA